MGKVAVVGREDNILCFLASGFRAFPVSGTDEAKEAVRRAKKEGCDVIFVSPELDEVIRWADEKYGPPSFRSRSDRETRRRKDSLRSLSAQ